MTQPLWICRACRSHKMLRTIQHGSNFSRRFFSARSGFFKISEEVEQAIADRRPVVALETTIYTHGFPYPDNLALASRLESLVRSNGGVPATIGILDGMARVGLAADELDRLVSSAGSSNLLKISRRDMAFACSLRDPEGKPYNGGTTIAGTVILAHLAGIRVFATGGLGGVHRGVEETMDVSADLTELGRTPVAVISSGCKSFLDIPRTLEFLETQGVAVATFADGRSGPVDFPAFYSRDSVVKSPMVLENEIDAAKVLQAHFALGLQSGLAFSNPIPEQYSIPHQQMEVAIHEALSKAKGRGVTGAAATPYILTSIKELTGNKSVEANRALVEANVIRGTKVAKALVQLEAEIHNGRPESQVIKPAEVTSTTLRLRKESYVSSEQPSKLSESPTHETSLHKDGRMPEIFVAGSLALDFACDYMHPSESEHTAAKPTLNTSNPARITQSLGGVGSNVARAAHLMGGHVHLTSAVGDDLSGKAVLEALAATGLPASGVKVLSIGRTAQYVAVNDSNKDLHLAMADMNILESASSEAGGVKDTFDNFWLPQLRNAVPKHLVLDANWSPGHLARWLEAGKEINAHVTFEPVSNVKGAKLMKLPKPHSLSVFPRPSVNLVTPNLYELAALHAAARESGAFDRNDWWEVIDAFGIRNSGARTQLALATSSQLVDQGIPQQSIQLLPFMPSICTKLGAEGVLLTQIIPANDERLQNGEYAPFILSRCANGTEDTLGVGGVYMRLFPAVEEIKAEDVVSVNGVGDTFAGTLVAGLSKKGKDGKVEELVDLAQRAAILTLKSRESVSPGLGTLRILM